MKTIAIYNLKGGVGKTTLSVNLAWCSAAISSRKTLLWDLDPQAAASYILGDNGQYHDEALAVFTRDINAKKLISHSPYSGLDILSSDNSLREIDRTLFEIGKKKRLSKLIGKLSNTYDRVILDCPPGLSEISDQILRAADLVIVPVIPSPLSQRAFLMVQQYLNGKKGKHAPMLPVFNMVDMRRNMHKEALAEHPKWPIIPNSSDLEKMSEFRRALGDIAPSSPAQKSITSLWRAIERKIAVLD